MIINPTTYLGTVPPPHKKGRQILPYSANKSPAYIPELLLSPDPSNAKPVDQRLDQLPAVSLKLLKSLETDIKHHVGARFQLFWQSALLVYQSKFAFSHHATLLQVGKGKGCYAAAHSSTTPSLAVEDHDKRATFLRGTNFDLMQNTTTFLPVAVNKIDSRLDHHHGKMKTSAALHNRAIEILNDVSMGREDPSSAMQRFNTALLELIPKAKNAASEKKPKDAEQEHYILGLYEKVAKVYQKSWSNDTVRFFCFKYRREDAGLQINQDFYLRVQWEMYQTLAVDPVVKGVIQTLVVARIRPLAQPASTLVNAEELAWLKKNLTAVQQAMQGLRLSKRGKEYTAFCTSSESIAQLAKTCLSQKPQIIKEDLKALAAIKTSVTLERHSLSEKTKQFCDQALTRIRASSLVQSPQQLGTIFMQVLQTSGAKKSSH